MKTCSCKNNLLPVETCVVCANKHVSTALSLFMQLQDSEDITNSYIIGQLRLASWHYNSNYEYEKKLCLNIVDKIFHKYDYKNDLLHLSEVSWDYVNQNQPSQMENYKKYEIKQQQNANSLQDSIVYVCTANALYNYEINYKSINQFYAIGQLNLATWYLQHNNYTEAKQCRQCWKKIQSFQNCKSQLDLLQRKLWNLFVHK